MRNSSDLSMFDLTGSFGVLFEDCNIHDNDSSGAYEGVFVQTDEYGDVIFKNCEFKDNTYKRFSDYSVTLEQCSVDDNVLKNERDDAQG